MEKNQTRRRDYSVIFIVTTRWKQVIKRPHATEKLDTSGEPSGSLHWSVCRPNGSHQGKLVLFLRYCIKLAPYFIYVFILKDSCINKSKIGVGGDLPLFFFLFFFTKQS